jgi:hypothetical protein
MVLAASSPIETTPGFCLSGKASMFEKVELKACSHAEEDR